MKNLILPIILLAFTHILIAQESKLVYNEGNTISSDRFRDVKGTPFITKEWNATIWFGEDSYVTNVPINYNAEKHQ